MKLPEGEPSSMYLELPQYHLGDTDRSYQVAEQGGLGNV